MASLLQTEKIYIRATKSKPALHAPTLSHPCHPLDAPNALGMWGQHHDGDD